MSENGNLTAKKPEAASKRRRTVKKPEATNHKAAPQKLKLLITVVDRTKAEFYMDLIQSFDVNMQFCSAANGTATSEIRSLMGLEESEKTVIFSTVREDRAAKVLSKLEEKFATIKHGKGIAMTVPLTGVIGVAIYQFLSNNRQGRMGAEQ